MNFRDGTIILLPGVQDEKDKKIVTYFNKKGERKNYLLEKIVADYKKSGKMYPGMVKRLKYTLTIMTALSMKKSLQKVDEESKLDLEEKADIEKEVELLNI